MKFLPLIAEERGSEEVSTSSSDTSMKSVAAHSSMSRYMPIEKEISLEMLKELEILQDEKN